MHEAAIVESLLHQVVEKIPLRAEVHRVHLRIGRLTNVSPDALNFYFEAYRDDWLGKQCELTVTQPPLRACCQNCGREQDFVEWIWECTVCHTGQLIYLNGSELELEAIEVKDVGDHSDS
jgi:hydrogenase nickel insertion protein HypA